tara:strand:- start:430 stop:930 length:501 start_codon:yes stop_codon:yes gene_type:complete
MTSKQKIETLFKVCIDKIILYCLSHKIDYRYESTDDSKLDVDSVSELLDVYTEKFMTVFETNHDVLTYEYPDVDEYQDAVSEFVDRIGISSAMHYGNRKNVENMITTCLSEIKLLFRKKKEEIKAGVCCFCKGDCNPMSQSCGQCARGISGAAIGIPVPYHLKKFL